MVCPKCGEDNSDNFRYCGLCGTLLEARVESRRPVGAPVPNLPKMPAVSDPLRPTVQNATNTPNTQVPSISGPSMLGLDQPAATQSDPGQRSSNYSGPNQPSMDSLREKSFSGLDSFFEPEQPKNGGRRVLLLLVLLAALGGAGWWTYTNYLGATESRKPEAAASNDETPAETPSTKPAAKDAAATPDANSFQAKSPSVPEGPSENATASPDAAAKPPAEPKPPTPTPSTSAPSTSTPSTSTPSTKIAPAEKIAAKREPTVASARASKSPAPAVSDTGDAEFRKAEAYLYGRGAAQNCDEAVKYLKAASAKSNAKARSTFGTMYATGHCAPRDLPTSYLWFAMALRVDPNNQILEKDLSAVWNQMTPPERQMATRMKQ